MRGGTDARGGASPVVGEGDGAGDGVLGFMAAGEGEVADGGSDGWDEEVELWEEAAPDGGFVCEMEEPLVDLGRCKLVEILG